MRIEVVFVHEPYQKLPINYQYLISSWIYSVLSKGDEEYASWLHKNGFKHEGKTYKHFCFSMLHPKTVKIHPREKVIELVEGPSKIVISFNIDEATQHLVQGLFGDNEIQLSSGNFLVQGKIKKVQLLPKPDFSNSMSFRAITPICISVKTKEQEYPDYLHPLDEKYENAFINNLVDKANSYFGYEEFNPSDVTFHLIQGPIRSKLWTIKGIDVKGYLFDFALEGPKELLEIGYLSGFGIQNSSLGMGMTKVK